MKRVLVTGGCGFIGSNFLRFFLSENPECQVVNLDKLTYAGRLENTADFSHLTNYRFVRGDICDTGLVDSLMKQADAVIHFAAETHVDRSIDSSPEFIRTNLTGTNVLLDSAKRHGIRKFIHFSTDEVYGSIAEGDADESFPLNPTSPYAASKAGSDLLALAYWKTHELPVIVMRCSNNYGPYQFPEKVIPLFITNLIEGRKVPLYAKGENRRDWLYVGDCVRAVGFVFQNGIPGEIYNVAGNCELSNIELTRMILKHFGKGDEAIQYVNDRPAHDFRYALDASKLEKMGFSVTSIFEERLRETADFYANHPQWWKPLKTDSYTLK